MGSLLILVFDHYITDLVLLVEPGEALGGYLESDLGFQFFDT